MEGMTLDEKVKALKPELGEWRDELQTLLRTLRVSHDYIAVLLKMSRLCLKLLEQLYQESGKPPPQGAKNLNEWIKDAQQIGILPEEITTLMHTLRKYHNIADHPIEKITLTLHDAEIAMEILLRVLEWFFWRTKNLESIYIPLKPPRFRKAFTTLPQPPRNFVDRENELRRLLDWLDTEGCPVFIVGAMGGQGKTALAAKFVSTLRLAERSVQVRWVNCDDALSVDDLLNDFAEEMHKHHFADARNVKDTYKPLRSRLDVLIHFLEYSPDLWLLVLDDYHSLSKDREKWDELVKSFAQGCSRTKLLLLTRIEPEVASYPKLPVGSCEELRLPELPKEVAQEFLTRIGLEVDEEQADEIWSKCSGSPLAMILFAQAAKRRGSIQVVLELPLPEWSENARAWLDELQRDLTPMAQDVLKRLSIFIEPVEWEVVVATGGTQEEKAEIEQGLFELDRAYLLERTDDGRIGLHDFLCVYWLKILIQETIDELGGDKFIKEGIPVIKFSRRTGEIIRDLTLEDILNGMYSVEYIDKGKINKWLNNVAEWIVDKAPHMLFKPLSTEELVVLDSDIFGDILFGSLDFEGTSGIVYIPINLLINTDCAFDRLYLLFRNKIRYENFTDSERISKKLLNILRKYVIDPIFKETVISSYYLDDSEFNSMYAEVSLLMADCFIKQDRYTDAERIYHEMLEWIKTVLIKGQLTSLFSKHKQNKIIIRRSSPVSQAEDELESIPKPKRGQWEDTYFVLFFIGLNQALYKLLEAKGKIEKLDNLEKPVELDEKKLEQILQKLQFNNARD